MDEFYRKRRITGEKYNIFDKSYITIMNIRQASFYMEYGVELWDVYPSRDRKTDQPVAAFVFRREDTKDAYEVWCERKADKNGEDITS